MPETVPAGTYAVLLKAETAEILVSQRIDINILPEKPRIDLLLKRQIEALRENFKKIRGEADILQARGGDTSRVLSLLKTGNNVLDRAEYFWVRSAYDTTKEQLGIAVSYLQQAADELAKIRLPVRTFSTTVVFVIIVAFVLGLTAALHLKQGKKLSRAEKMLHYLLRERQRASEEGIQKDNV